jgi:hypothetical protein
LYALPLLLQGGAVTQLPEQENDAARKRFAEIRARAEGGDAKEEAAVALCYYHGDCVGKDATEAAR